MDDDYKDCLSDSLTRFKEFASECSLDEALKGFLRVSACLLKAGLHGWTIAKKASNNQTTTAMAKANY